MNSVSKDNDSRHFLHEDYNKNQSTTAFFKTSSKDDRMRTTIFSTKQRESVNQNNWMQGGGTIS